MGKRELGQAPTKVCSTGGALSQRRLALREPTCRMAQFSFGCDRSNLTSPTRSEERFTELELHAFPVCFPSSWSFLLTSELCRCRNRGTGRPELCAPGPCGKTFCTKTGHECLSSTPSPTLPRAEGAKGSRPATPQPRPAHAQPPQGERAARPRPPPPRPATHCSAGHSTADRGCPPAAAFPPSRAAALVGPGDAAPASRTSFSARLAPGHAPGWGMVPRLMGPPAAGAPQRFRRSERSGAPPVGGPGRGRSTARRLPRPRRTLPHASPPPAPAASDPR